jgi:hypothetical protein
MSIYRQCAAGILAIGMGVSILGQTGENQSHVILDFGRCVPERKTISFALGSTTYELKKEQKKTCRLRYGTEIENPLWDGTLDTSCTVPRRIGKRKFVITGQGVDFSPLARYCKSDVN